MILALIVRELPTPVLCAERQITFTYSKTLVGEIVMSLATSRTPARTLVTLVISNAKVVIRIRINALAATLRDPGLSVFLPNRSNGVVNILYSTGMIVVMSVPVDWPQTLQ
jgi:hypothetical protein